MRLSIFLIAFSYASILTVFSGNVSAAALCSPQNERELLFLPRDCQEKFTDTKKPGTYVLRGAHNIGHFCQGLVCLERGKRHSDSKTRKGWISHATKEMDYTIKYTDEKHPTQAYMKTRRAELHYYLGNTQKMQSDMLDVLSLNPKYTKAYLLFSSFYEREGRIEGAIKILKTGLHHIPNSKALKRRIERLEMKLNK